MPPPPPQVALFVTDKLPWPLDDGGQIRSWHMLQALARTGPVRVLARAPEDPAAAQALRAQGFELELFAARNSAVWKVFSLARALFTRRPHPLPKNHSGALRAALRRMLDDGGVRHVHFNHLDAAQYLLNLDTRQVATSIDTHNLLTGLYRRLESESRNPLARAYVHLQWRKMAAMEPRILRRAQRVFVCSEQERAQLRVWGIDRARVVPNGVDTEHNQPQPRPPDGRQRLVFCGGMDYLPNQDGVRWFLDSIWPELVRTQPGLELLIVGKNPPRDLAARAGGAVRFTGRVEDVRPLVSSADLSIVPLRIGGGTRLKILESLALERAVVSTSTGAEGLELEAGKEIALADEPQAFAGAVRELLADPARRERMAQAGRARVLAQYDWRVATATAFD